MREQWVPMTSIPEVAGWYEISDQGRIRYAVGAPTQVLHGSKVGDEKRLNLTGRGYLYVQIWHSGKTHGYRVHRLVAQHFIPNPNGYNEVNHIDGNKLNNAASNLEWCDHSANVRHSFATGLKAGHRWTDEEKEHLRRKSKEWCDAHPQRKYEQTYYERNTEKVKAYGHAYYVAHREELLAKQREERKRKKEAKKVPTA